MRRIILSTLLVLNFILSFSVVSFCQVWVKTYSSNIYNTFSYKLLEDYDHGILIGGNISSGTNMKIGRIIKTDINGNVIWEKKLGNGVRKWGLLGIDKTPDGGLIATGVCDTLDQNLWDPFVVKLTPCGDIQWCHIFQNANDPDYGMKIRTLPDNSFICLFKDWGSEQLNSTWLLHLDQNGEIIWEQQYFQDDTLVSPFNLNALEVTADGRYLVTGTCYRPFAGQTQLNWIWPEIILADSTGQAVWEIPWGYTLPFTDYVGGEGFQSVKTSSAIYSSISHYFYPEPQSAPCLIKTSLTGEPVSYHDLIPNTSYGKASTITKLSDSVLLIGVGYEVTTPPKLSVFKTDTIGNILAEKVLNNKNYIPMDAILTKDNKYLITAWDVVNDKFLFYLWKLNTNLQYDSIYTQPRVYDSLCPHPIASSTLYFQCDLAVGMVEPIKNIEKIKMHIYPNPGHEIIHIEMPEYLQKQLETEHVQVTTIFHKWYTDLDFEVFDLFGKLIFHQIVKPTDKVIQLNVSSWKNGLYYFRLSAGGTVVAKEKVIVK